MALSYRGVNEVRREALTIEEPHPHFITPLSEGPVRL